MKMSVPETETPVNTRTVPPSVPIKQVNANTLTEERTKQGGKYHTTVRTVVSADGKALTTKIKGVGADGKPTTATATFDKQ